MASQIGFCPFLAPFTPDPTQPSIVQTHRKGTRGLHGQAPALVSETTLVDTTGPRCMYPVFTASARYQLPVSSPIPYTGLGV